MRQDLDAHRWRLLTQGAEYWAAVAEDCHSARRRIDVEQYIFSDDQVGRHLVALLAAKAQQGLRVRILVDYFGSLDLLDSTACSRLRTAGAEVVGYNPFWRRPLIGLRKRIRRDHRKIVLADDIAYVGSACFKAEMANWRELNVRLEGPVVADIAETFEAVWRRAAGGRRLRIPRSRQRADFEFLGNPAGRVRALYRRILHEVSQARREVILCSPYLVPDRRFMSAIASAKRRGAAVTIVVPQHIDSTFVDAVGWSYYGRLLRAGCRIVLYTPVVLHAKSVVVDGRWATVGSMNLDRLSFHFNLEGNIGSAEKRFVDAIEAELKAMIQASEELDLETWRNRPWRKRLLGAIGRPLSPVL